jgi:pyruvate formate lyase activating enzyme
MTVYGLKKLTLIDYPEHIACTAFTHGCNLRCPFCHNPGLVIEEPNPADAVSEKELLAFLQKRAGKIDGIVFTGGEPLLHGQKLIDLLETMKHEMGLPVKVKIDTNGTFPSLLKVIIEHKLVDYIAMDFKTAPAEYDRMGASLEQIDHVLESLEIIKASRLPYEIRTTLVPGIHNHDTVMNMMSSVANTDRYVLQNFVPNTMIDPSFKRIRPFPTKTMHEFLEIAQRYNKNTLLRDQSVNS